MALQKQTFATLGLVHPASTDPHLQSSRTHQCRTQQCQLSQRSCPAHQTYRESAMKLLSCLCCLHALLCLISSPMLLVACLHSIPVSPKALLERTCNWTGQPLLLCTIKKTTVLPHLNIHHIKLTCHLAQCLMQANGQPVSCKRGACLSRQQQSSWLRDCHRRQWPSAAGRPDNLAAASPVPPSPLLLQKHLQQ